jgi:TatD DNase family protein
MQLVDTHCHVHFSDYELGAEEVIAAARAEGVSRLICVGCTLEDSREATRFANKYESCFASIGLHPHEAGKYVHHQKALQEFRALVKKPKVVAVGECGLDYYYRHSEPDQQAKMLRFQLDLAVENDLPLIFHIRDIGNPRSGKNDAFDDFWQIFDKHSTTNKPLRGVVHSFSASEEELEQILERDLYVGLNGIMTFSNKRSQLEAAKNVPLNKLLLETDAPFLTPVPFRGKICQPKYVQATGRFLADLRGEAFEDLAKATTDNARKLFGI